MLELVSLTTLLSNPFIIIGILLFLAILIYFGFEVTHKHHKTQDERIFIKVLWGSIAVLAGVSLLFTPLFNYLSEVVSGNFPVEKEVKSLFYLNNLCKANLPLEKYISSGISCGTLKIINYLIYAVIFVSLIILLIAFNKKEPISESSESEEEKERDEQARKRERERKKREERKKQERIKREKEREEEEKQDRREKEEQERKEKEEDARRKREEREKKIKKEKKTEEEFEPEKTEISDSKFCIECGSKIKRKAKFCPECGAKQ